MRILPKRFPLNFAGEGDPPAGGGSGEVRGECPCCHSVVFVEAGTIKGGGPSEFLQELQRKADASDEWRNKAAALELEHASRDIADPAPNTDPAHTPPAEDVEYFL